MPGRFLNIFKPIAVLMPEVKAPERKVGFGEKLFWTAIVLVIYLIMTEIPIYGIELSGTSDPLLYLRVLFASNRGTLMELGIQPIATAGLILQLLAGSGIINVDFSNSEDRAVFTSITKFFSILMTIFLASAYLFGGVYGPIGLENSLYIFIQLIAAGLIVMLLDELLQKGWGLGSGISLFILAGVAQKILWSCFYMFPVEEGGRAFGAIIAYIQALFAGDDPLRSFYFRTNPDWPTMMGFIATIILFVVVVFFEDMKIELPIAHSRFRGFRARYPVKLLYVSNIPVILVSALFMDVYFVAQILWSRFHEHTTFGSFIKILGDFNASNPSQPIGGIAYYISAPRNFTTVMQDPLRALIYAGLLTLFCILLAMVWIEVGGLGPRSVAEQLVDSGMQIPGFRRSAKIIESILDRYISTVTILGALIVGLIASCADFFGVFGTGMGVLLSVGIVNQYYQIFIQEQLIDMNPIVRRFIGR